MSKIVQEVIVGYQPSWAKWPDTNDLNYDSVLSWRSDYACKIGDETVTVRRRWYPVHRAYVVAGVLKLPAPHPAINNLMVPPKSVLDAMTYDLECVANDGCQLCVWEHAYQCYPEVAQHLKRLFVHSTLISADDSPGSTEPKTAPIAKFFNSAILCNVTWNASGERTSDLYRRLGVDETYYVALSCTGGFMEGMATSIGLRYGGAQTGHDGPMVQQPFDLERRIAQIRSGAYAHDLVFVGVSLGSVRQQLNLPETSALFSAAGLRTRIHGWAMRDGELLPRTSTMPGHPVAMLYLNSFATVNPRFVGLMGTRPFDAWASGTLLVQHDPVGEMEHIGLKSGVHYASYDGTVQGLIRTVKYYKTHLDETEAILREGYRVGKELPEKYSIPGAINEILRKNRERLGW